jgi:hypothetical protein
MDSPASVPGGYLSTLPLGGSSQPRSYSVAQGNTARVAGPGATLAQQIGNRSWLQYSSIETLKQFADMTGGKAFYKTNDLATSFRRASDDASSYYLIGYYLDTRNDRAGWRQLKVRLDKKDAEVRAREGFLVTNSTIHHDLTRNSDVTYALRSPLEGTGVSVSMEWLGVSGEGGKKDANFLVHLPPNSVSVNSAAGENHLDFDLAVAAFANNSKNTQPVIITGKTYAMALSDTQLASLRNRGVDMKNALRRGWTVHRACSHPRQPHGQGRQCNGAADRKLNRVIRSAQSRRSFESAGWCENFAAPRIGLETFLGASLTPNGARLRYNPLIHKMSRNANNKLGGGIYGSRVSGGYRCGHSHHLRVELYQDPGRV